jgi:hypothetical protein
VYWVHWVAGKPVRVTNQTRGCCLITGGRLAHSFWGRLRGLMGQSRLLAGDGLVLVGDKSIHTFFMRFPIDAVYVDRAWRVVRLEPDMPAWRFGPVVRRAAYVVELPAGVIRNSATAVGDQLTYTTASTA